MDNTFYTRKKKELNRIKKNYKNLPAEKLKILEKLMERAAYMLVSLEEMEQKITEDGLLVEMPQGDYTITRAHPLLSQYNAMVKNFNSTIKMLSDASEDSDSNKAGQELMRFLTKKPPAKK